MGSGLGPMGSGWGPRGDGWRVGVGEFQVVVRSGPMVWVEGIGVGV